MPLAAYREAFEIDGVMHGIEDFEQKLPPGEHHFMPDRTDGKRFMCWRGGGGIGRATTMKEARKIVHAWARESLVGRYADLARELQEVGAELEQIGFDPKNLKHFKLKGTKG